MKSASVAILRRDVSPCPCGIRRCVAVCAADLCSHMWWQRLRGALHDLLQEVAAAVLPADAAQVQQSHRKPLRQRAPAHRPIYQLHPAKHPAGAGAIHRAPCTCCGVAQDGLHTSAQRPGPSAPRRRKVVRAAGVGRRPGRPSRTECLSAAVIKVAAANEVAFLPQARWQNCSRLLQAATTHTSGLLADGNEEVPIQGLTGRSEALGRL